jgi:5'-3' exonuclease
MSEQLVIAVDVSNVLFRMAFAVREPNVSEVSYRFWCHVRAWERYWQPRLLVFCVDRLPGSPSFRNLWYPEYKATRVRNEAIATVVSQVVEQIPINSEMIGRQLLTCQNGCEADDVIAAVVAKARKLDWRAAILSSDKDLRQLLVKGSVSNIKTVSLQAESVHSAEYVTAESFEAEHGIRPDQLADYLALVGDTSDNVPGCPGIGDKIATGLLTKFQTLDAIVAAKRFALPLSKKQEASLRAWANDPNGMRLSRALVKLYPPEIGALKHSPESANVV